MNKNLYRIVFNKARGMLMVVADIARSGRAGSSRASGIGQTHSQMVGKVSVLSFSLWLAMGVVQTAQANIVANGAAPKNQQPTVIQSANGTPQVNIQTPSKAGVSRNNYTQFDINQKGAILNNSHKNVQTQLGGMVAANPWLARGEAKIILNEVSSRDPSRLNGTLEVAGQKAQVVIANPAGITCSGCGFINANRATLTTGQAQMTNGNLTGYNVERGEVVIDGAGMDTSGADYTDIIARSVKVNAGLWARDLKVTTGRNKVDATHERIEKGAPDAAASPQLAVDVASLGGMYAGKIRMVGTEEGVGVRNAGAIGAQAGSVTIDANGRIENSGIARASDSATLATTGELSNSGVITAGKNTQLKAATLTSSKNSVLAAGVNSDGRLTDKGDLTLDTRGQLTARGQTLAGGNLSARGQGLDISGSQTQGKQVLLDGGKGDLNTQNAQVNASTLTARTGTLLNNDGGSLNADAISVSATSLSNQKGRLIQTGTGTLAVTLPGSIDNRQGQIAANGNVQLGAQTSLDNSGGQVLAVAGSAGIDAGSLINEEGLISASAGDGTIRSAQSINNTRGRIEAAKTQRITAAGLNNQQGTLVAQGNMDIAADQIDNQNGGQLIGGASTALHSAALQNSGGQIQSVGDLLIESPNGRVDNSAGLIRGGNAVTLAALTFENQNTLGDNQGLEGRDITLTTGTLNNQSGIILADNALTVRNSGELNNTAGGLASSGLLDLGGDGLRFINQGGTAKAGRQLNVQADSLDASGQLLSLGDMALHSVQSVDNSGTTIANGSATLTTQGDITNSGKLLAGSALTVQSANLTNNASGEITAGRNTLTTSGTLQNRGLIDGTLTRINADTLTNTGTGRIYGDAVGVNAGTFNNLAENGTAATLAGRERVDLGVGTLNNRDHALIYSAGDMLIGGALTENGAASGRAQAINNHSATIESAGDMAIAAGQINNINDHFSTAIVRVSQEQLTEYQHSGSTNLWKAGDEGVYVNRDSADGLLNLNTPEKSGEGNDTFNQYDYTRTVDETRIQESDPAKILAGGNLTLSGDRLFNDNSQIIAGGTLATDAMGEVKNDDVTGERQTTDVGTVTHYYRIRHKGSDDQGRDRTAYVPPTAIQSITLKPGQLISNGSVAGSNLTIAPMSGQTTSVTIGATGAVANQAEINPDASVIRIISPNTTLPDSSLFKVNPSADVPWLVETDPRFTNERQWLGSDYMQNAFTQDGDNTLKRLGDGYYEQRLVREQVVGITGQRYLDGFNNDEDQFKSLMDQGITFGRQYALKIGVALTPAQMALLTGDIVWLVNTRVKMPDGSMENVLVPQVYAKVKQGDIDGSGALIAGNNVSMKLNGDLFNTGTIAGRRVLQLEANNITSQTGLIQGADVSLAARNDITSIDGAIVGNNSLTASAGRDITLTSTVNSAESQSGKNSFTRTTMNSVSGIYVQGDDGKLALQSGRDITLTGAQVIASGENGKAQLVAGRDLNLDTVTTARSDSLVWDGDNTLTQSRQDHTGSLVSGVGGVTLAAGNDLNARGASVKSDGVLALGATHDVNITGVLNNSQLDERHKVVGGNGWLSKTTTTTRDTVDKQTVQGSELSAGSVKISAGNNLLVAGSSVAGTDDVALRAGNDLTLTTMGGRNEETHLKQEKKSGLLSSGGIGFTLGSRKETTEQASQALAGQGAMVGSLQGDTVLLAGNDYRQTGSSVASPNGNVVIQGKNVTIDAAQNTYASQYKRTVEQKGFTLAVNVPVVQALQSVLDTVQDVGKSNDDRINMLAAANAAWSSARAASTMMNAAQGVMANGAQAAAQNVSVSLTYGQSKQTSTDTTDSTSALASTVNAGKNAVVVATGGEKSTLNIIGSDVSGKQSTTLFADDDVNILAAQQERHERSDNKSSGWNAGIAVSYGQGGASFGITAGANKGKGYGNGDELSWRNSHVGDMDGVTRITSGGDTTLRGGQVLGNAVEIAAQNLYIESLQDTMKYDGKQMSMGGQVTVGYGFAASGNYGQSKVNADYASVQEQSGIFAGDRGYNINVNDRTDLKGGLITSTEIAELAGNNQLSTGTLSWSDIHNRSEYEGSAFGIGGSMSMNTDMGLGDNAARQSGKTVTTEEGNQVPAEGYASLDKHVTFGLGHDSGSESSVTRSGINTSNITLTRPEGQQQAIEGVKTDITTETAAANSGRLDNNFDKDKVFKELNLQVRVTREFRENANNQINTYLDGKQAAARADLKQAIESGDVTKRDAALAEVYKLQYQRRFLQTLVGVVAGSPDVAITQGTLALAATKMREETIKNSLLFKGIEDTAGNVDSNVTGKSNGLYDGIKAGGVRVALDIYCNTNNIRCATVEGDPNTLIVNDKGHVVFTGAPKLETLEKLRNDPLAAGLFGPTGGFQGSDGMLSPFGTYKPGTFWGDIGDNIVESYAGTHDFIGGQLPGFYDEMGNTSRDRGTVTKIAAETWTVAAIPLATPFAMSELVSPELLNFIFSTSH